MSFIETLERASAFLERHGRLSFRALQREFDLDDEVLEELVEELVDVQQTAAREGRVLLWIGATGADASTPKPELQATAEASPEPTAPAPIESGERRQLTVMFCDLVGSTELSQRLDPEELSEVVRAYRAVCVEAAKRFDGHVAQYLGDGVMLYFGFPQAHEDDPSRAIHAALEIQRVLAERPEADRIDVRTGIHTGLVIVDPEGSGEDALALGLTSNMAARIEGLAKPGTVVVSDATLALCRGVFVTRSLGATELKGVEAPVLLHEVERSAGVRSAIAVDATKPMVGRDREVGLLLDRWEEVLEGRGQVVLVSGEPGMGKSRLLQALREELADAPHLWQDMQCSPFTSGSAFQPIVDLFQLGLESGSVDSPAEASERLVRGLEATPGLPAEKVIPYLLPLLSLPASERYPLPQTSADEQRRRTLAALVQLNQTLSEQQPVVVVVEDVHWSDPSTLDYLSRLIEQAPTTRLLLVLTFRPEFRAFWTQSHVSELKLARLSKRVTREMITNAVGGRLPEPVLAELETRSDGVPLFVEELAGGVVSSGVMTQRAGRFELRGSLKDLAIPATLQDSLMGRLDRLSASKHLAQQAATLGREFPYALIEAVTDLDTPALRTALEQLVTAEILHQRGTVPDAHFTFKHALLQDTAYASQLLSTRKALHGRIAAVLEEQFPKRVADEPERMARHCLAAGDHSKAVDHYQRAAELALVRLSNEEAAEYYNRALDALEMLPEDDERHQREIAIRVPHSKALMTLHGYEAPEVLETIARVEALCEAVGEGPQQLPARVGLAQFDIASGHMEKCRDHGEAILRIAEPLGIRELEVMGHVLIGSWANTSSSSVEADERHSRGISIAEQIDFPAPATPYDQDLITNLYSCKGNALVNLVRPEQAMQSFRLSRDRGLEIDHDLSRCGAGTLEAISGYMMDDVEFARSASEEALGLANGRGFHTQEMLAAITLGWARACQGEVDEGVRDVEQGLALAAASGSVAGLPLLYVAAAHVYRMAKRREQAEALIDRATAAYERTGEKAYAPHALFARGRIRLELGDGDPLEAERLFLEAVESAGSFDVLQSELIISTHLALLAPRTGKLRVAHDRLAGHYARLSEGFDRGPAREAKAALDELAVLLEAESAAS